MINTKNMGRLTSRQGVKKVKGPNPHKLNMMVRLNTMVQKMTRITGKRWAERRQHGQDDDCTGVPRFNATLELKEDL
jgi:hypothetical protein